jgi:hypothetical protein
MQCGLLTATTMITGSSGRIHLAVEHSPASDAYLDTSGDWKVLMKSLRVGNVPRGICGLLQGRYLGIDTMHVADRTVPTRAERGWTMMQAYRADAIGWKKTMCAEGFCGFRSLLRLTIAASIHPQSYTTYLILSCTARLSSFR